MLVDRTADEVDARCDMEAMDILSLKLLHDIVTRALSVEAAREKYAEEASAYMLDRPSAACVSVGKKFRNDLGERSAGHVRLLHRTHIALFLTLHPCGDEAGAFRTMGVPGMCSHQRHP